jgi:signal peptidase I
VTLFKGVTVSKSTGESLDVLAPLSDSRPLLAATAFGTSMYPFLKPGAEIRLEHCESAQVKPGDLLMFRSQAGVLITHRVVKILRVDGRRAFLTKGDNRIHCDPSISHDQVVGRVTHINSKFIRSRAYQAAGRVIAFLTYGQSVLCQVLSKSSLNRLRHFMEEKGGWPRISLESWFGRAANPLIWLAAFQAALYRFQIQNLKRRLLKQGVILQPWSEREGDAMTQLWNEAFPEYAVTADRLKRLVFQSVRFKEACYYLAKKDGQLLGWISVVDESSDARFQWPVKSGAIDIFVLSRKAWEMQLEKVLLQEALKWAQARGIRRIFLNPQPVPESHWGIAVTPLMIAASQFGFEPLRISEALTVSRENFHPVAPQALAPGISIRAYQEKDEPGVREFLTRTGRLDTRYFLDAAAADGLLIAVFKDQVVGFCRWVPEEKIADCNEVAWLWVVAAPARPRGYLFRLLVDQDFRSQGIGTAIAGRAFAELFQAGCQEIVLMTLQNDPDILPFYTRFGFRKTGSFIRMKRF